MKPPRLTNYEKETIVLYNESNEPAEIYTHNPKLIKKIMERNREYPEIFKITKVGQDGEITCQLPKNRLSINLKAPASEEFSRNASERMKKYHETNAKTTID